MAASQRDAYRFQDSVVVPKASPSEPPHAERRLRERGGRFAQANIRALFREAVPIPSKSSRATTVRYHEASGLLLISSYGCIKTVYRLDNRPESEQEQVRTEAEAMKE